MSLLNCHPAVDGRVWEVTKIPTKLSNRVRHENGLAADNAEYTVPKQTLKSFCYFQISALPRTTRYAWCLTSSCANSAPFLIVPSFPRKHPCSSPVANAGFSAER